MADGAESERATAIADLVDEYETEIAEWKGRAAAWEAHARKAEERAAAAKTKADAFSFEDWFTYSFLSAVTVVGAAVALLLVWLFIHWAAKPDEATIERLSRRGDICISGQPCFAPAP